MGTVTATHGPVTVLTVDGIAEVVRPGDSVDEERLAPFVLAELDDPDSYTASKLAREGKKAAKAKPAPKAEKEGPAAPAGEPGTDQQGEAPGEPGDAEKAEGGQPDAGPKEEPKDEAPAPPKAAPKRSRQA